MKYTLITTILSLLWLMSPAVVLAQEASISGGSATRQTSVIVVDERLDKLKTYLASHNSPMEGSAQHFIDEADRLDLDWKLVAAIAGVESTFGKHIPRDSYNAWGWGVFTNTSRGKQFDSWNHGITVVSEGLKYNYIDRGAVTLDQIGHRYAASPTWSQKVNYFLAKIENFVPKSVEHLAVTL